MMNQTNDTTKMTTEKPSRNETERSEEDEEGFKFEENIRSIIFGIILLLVFPILVYLKWRNKKQRRERAERRARNLENQQYQSQGQYNPAFETDYSVRY